MRRTDRAGIANERHQAVAEKHHIDSANAGVACQAIKDPDLGTGAG
jgi:hypothetical protein